MAKPWCAVIAATKDIAEIYLDAFGLSREMWAIYRHEDSLHGRLFDRIVVIRPHWRMDFEETARFERQITEHWRHRVETGGHFKVI
ncbi:hypothetical protein [Bradyrhizobium ottawaense]|nr:hypothetical protein [Bradyrhizobium ottawaense]